MTVTEIVVVFLGLGALYIVGRTAVRAYWLFQETRLITRSEARTPAAIKVDANLVVGGPPGDGSKSPPPVVM